MLFCFTIISVSTACDALPLCPGRFAPGRNVHHEFVSGDQGCHRWWLMTWLTFKTIPAMARHQASSLRGASSASPASSPCTVHGPNFKGFNLTAAGQFRLGSGICQRYCLLAVSFFFNDWFLLLTANWFGFTRVLQKEVGKGSSIIFFGTLSVTFWSLFLMFLSLSGDFFAKLLLPDSLCGRVIFTLWLKLGLVFCAYCEKSVWFLLMVPPVWKLDLVLFTYGSPTVSKKTNRKQTDLNLREGKPGDFPNRGFPTFFGKGPDCVADHFGNVLCRCIGRERGKGQIRTVPKKSGKSRKSGKSQKGQRGTKEDKNVKIGKTPVWTPPRLLALDQL